MSTAKKPTTKKPATKKATPKTAKKPVIKEEAPKATKFYILANGEGTRWNNYKGVAKQLVEVDGETILHRMIRLLREEGIEKENIVICGKLTDPEATTVLTKSKTKREVFEEVANLAQGTFVILYGDCYYTKAIIHEIVNRPIKKYDEFFCNFPNPWTGCPWPEGYAHRCSDWEWWRDTMHEINTNPKLINTPKDWYIHWWLLGVRDERINTPPEQFFNPDHDIFWLDETDDFDFPEDYDRFLELHERNKSGFRFDRLSIIIPNYNNGKTIGRVLSSLTQQKMVCGREVEIIVVDDGSTDNSREVIDGFGLVRKIYTANRGVSAARNTGLMASTGKYITFVDSDDIIEDSYIQTVFSEMDKGYDYCVFPWYDVQSDSVKFFFGEKIPNSAVWAYAFNWRAIQGELFKENMQVAEDLEWLKRVITDGKNRGQTDKVIYRYDWNANPDSLCKRFNRGDITLER